MSCPASPRLLHPLVTEQLIDSSKFFCPFFERGYCRENDCNFSHDLSASTRIPLNYCRFYLANQCMYGSSCKFRHDEPESDSRSNQPSSSLPIVENIVCDLCNQPCLNASNEEQQRQHREECLRDHERDMELSFAVQRSLDKICGICMETVIEKEPVICRRFGILEKCNHIFCLDCIRKWRGTRQFESKTIRACPECRVSSDFVVPSKYWVEECEDKETLITAYKEALKSKPCKYFNRGLGECPFAGSCFYKHAYPDGKLAQLGKPRPRRKNNDSEDSVSALALIFNLLHSVSLPDDSNSDEEEDEDDEDFFDDATYYFDDFFD